MTGTTLDLVPDADWNGTANITVTVNDGNGSTDTETFDLVVNPVNDAPTALNLDNDTIQEGKPIASLVGQFSTTDVDTGDTFTYSLVAGSGDTGNGSFSISGNQLLSAAVFNYIAQSSYSIRVNVSDSGGGMYEKIFTITIEQGGALTINSYPPAGGSTSGAGDYTPGDTATATATPASGYIFAGWTGDIPSGANAGDTPLSVLMDANKTLNAYFTRAFHTVDVSVFPERHGYAHGGGVILNGTSITLTAQELTGGDNVPFSHWRINGTDTANTAPTLTLTVDQEYQIEAVFDMGLSDNFVLVPAQTYMREKNTRYEHNASVSAFYISKYEITKDEWYNVYNWAIVNGYSFEFDPINYNGYIIPHNDPSYPGDYSIIGVYWNDMVKWCNARSEKEGFTPSYFTDAGHSTVHRSNFFASTAESLTNDDVSWRNRGYRLPTEAEWEAAARGGYQNLAYPSGHTIDSNQAFYDQDLDDLPITSATLHSRIPNGYGIYDMAGNGWEACWDWMSKYWYDNPGSASLDTAGPTLLETNLKNNFRAIRGGSGHSNHKWTRVNARYFPTVWDRFPITIRPVFPAPSTPDATLRVVTQQGSSGSVTGGGIYEIGSSATLQAIPEGTATFVEWQDADQNTLGTANTLIYTASADATIYAIFTETTLPGADLYTVSTQTNPHGSGTLSGQGTYVSGHTVEFTATAADGYLFSGFYGDALGTSSPLNITVDQNMTVWGAFENDKMSMDSDTDGLTDYYELAIGSDPFTRDTDGDQIADGIEVDSYGSDPLAMDTDGDGHSDSIEFMYTTDMLAENYYPFFPKDELIRHFPFAGGIALDAGPLTVHGVASNVISAIDRHSDASSAFTFNGLTSQVTVGGYNGATGSTARSIAGWIKVLAGDGPILDYGTAPNAFSLSITPAGLLQVEADAASITGSTNLKDGNWHQFVVSFPEGGSASDISVYIDGAAETTTSSGDTASVLATVSSSPVTIGKSTIGQFFVGDLDEVRLWERALPAWEVTQLYNLESVAQPPETPITIDVQPVTTTVAYMDPATLSVTISGGISPIFQWEAQYGKAWHYIPGENSANLTFPNAIDYDGRSYRCGIIDQHGNVTYTSVVRLYVLHPPTLPEPEPDWQFVTTVGGKIVANTEGTKRIEWEWFKDGVSLGTTNKNMYLIPNTANQAVHGGDYHYIATNSIGSVTSNTFTVSIIDPTEITQHPESTGILQGSSGTLTVVAAGGGTLDYQWLKYNPATGNNDEVDGATSPTLTISAMDASKEGQYSCQVSNGPSVRISKRANVTMWVAPVFTTQPLNISVNEYTPAQLDSLATGDPAPTYQWQKFTAGSWVDVPRYINNTFLLKKALSSHAGTYRVVATNDGGSAISNSAIITVYYKPVITVDIDHITANEDTDVTFNVVANALDATGTSIGYQWYYNNAPLSDGPGITGSNKATLVLTNVNRANNYGVYYCQLSNAVGVSKTRARRLNIVDKPISYVPLTDKTLIAGGKLYLAVSVKGAKPLTMQWYKDGTAIPGAIYSKYIITSVTTGDSGLYTLIATNPAGSVQGDANVTVAAASVGAPPPPIVADASNPIEDADLDGVSNLLEEAFGSDPLDPKSTSKPEIEIVDDGTGDLYTSIRYNHSKSAIGIDLVLEGSTDLQNWAPVDLSDATVSQLDRENHVEVTIYLPVTTDQMYFRMQVSN